MRLKETMIKRLFNLYDDIFDKLKLEIYTDELGTIYGKWFDKNEKLIFSRNHFGTLWVDNCDSYTTLWIYSKSVSLNKEEFELSLIDYLNQKYQKQSKNRPIKSIGDENHCLEDMEDETENLQETIRRILREELKCEMVKDINGKIRDTPMKEMIQLSDKNFFTNYTNINRGFDFGEKSYSTGKPLRVYRDFEDRIILLDGHHRISDKITECMEQVFGKNLEEKHFSQKKYIKKWLPCVLKLKFEVVFIDDKELFKGGWKEDLENGFYDWGSFRSLSWLVGDENSFRNEGFMKKKFINTQLKTEKILREELDNNSLSTYVRRVVNLTDENIKKILKGEIAYHSNRRLGGESLDQFLQRITFDTAGELTKWFGQEEYDKNFDSVEKYIKDNYTDFIFDYFNETFKEDEESKFCFIKHSERYGGRGFTECTDSWFKFLNKFVSWLPNTDWNKVKEELKTKDRVLLARPLEGHIYEYYFSVLKR